MHCVTFQVLLRFFVLTIPFKLSLEWPVRSWDQKPMPFIDEDKPGMLHSVLVHLAFF